MKVRVLYPTGVMGHTKHDPVAGDIIDVDATLAEGLIAAGYVEVPNAKPVEQATQAPGEKRQTRKKA